MKGGVVWGGVGWGGVGAYGRVGARARGCAAGGGGVVKGEHPLSTGWVGRWAGLPRQGRGYVRGV